MASKFVRSVKDIYNLEKFNKHLVDQNDIISTHDGTIYIYSDKKGFLKLGNEIDETVIEKLKKENKTQNETINENKTKIETIDETLKQTRTKTTQNENELNEQKSKISTLEQSKNDYNQRISGVEQKSEQNRNDIVLVKQDFKGLINDTGWLDIELKEGYTTHSSKPQYRIIKIGSVVSINLRGSLKGINGTSSQTVGNIPVSSLISRSYFYLNNGSISDSKITIDRWKISGNGDIVFEGTTSKSLNGNEWHQIDTVFYT